MFVKLSCLSSQSNEETKTKKRKGTLKDGEKTKKPKTGKGQERNLTLNTSAKCVEILHIKVIDLLRIFI